jgi:cholesterol oxidase
VLPRISRQLGSRFTVNGDYLAFFVNAREKIGGVEVARVMDPSYGPVITSAIRIEDALDSGGSPDPNKRGFYIEDGGYPEFFNWMISIAQIPGFLERFFAFGKHYLWGLLGWDPNHDMGSAVSQLIGPNEFTKSSFPLLAMGRDIPDGTMSLKGKNLNVDWSYKGSEQYFQRLRGTLRELTE